MSIRFTRNTIGLILLFFLLVSCNKSKINGHWHISRVENPDIVYFTLDIKDTLASYGRYSFYGEVFGYHDIRKKEIDLPGQCGSGLFRYELKGDSLFLEGRALGDYFIGFRCDSTCCSLAKDYFRDSSLDIDLPLVTENNSESMQELPHYLFANLLVGVPNKDYREKYGDKIQIQFKDEPEPISEIEHWVELEESKVPKRDREKIKFIIYADRGVPPAYINEIIDELVRLNHWLIFLGYKDERKGQEKMPLKRVHYRKVNLAAE